MRTHVEALLRSTSVAVAAMAPVGLELSGSIVDVTKPDKLDAARQRDIFDRCSLVAWTVVHRLWRRGCRTCVSRVLP